MKNEKVNVGIVLAGGRSSRFGEPKAFFQDEATGKTWVELTVSKLMPLCEMVFVSANHENYSKLVTIFDAEPAIQIVPDQAVFSNFGPLGGIYAVMKAAANYQKANFLVLPVDMPFLTSKEIGQLADYPNHFAKTEQANHYLVANIPYSRETLHKLLQDEQHRVRALLEKLDTKPLAFEDEAPFRNINRQNELF
ncbi:molybdenum cofactor guanylyltransferase [Listeria monocytogenes]|uniref:molybdenum cofactor guanylyltransferase n=1 Tax=Listeria monocytogenes TaxID=1639 RepID=UPI000873F2D3|nr:molybdenum cofactor guanylyltransferase [Listeria monocytogenes]EAC7320535.1 molybdenum cofactor guanylyltransferase [Listeria monocytogenes]EAD0023244.1 molybdenum cofactor guanylyltransferase [Listeria monocytogenes]EAD9895735.1 molybdenum cofactor guanylyltransferase [Listeria monocytogenes]EAF6093149.1 molybdenum cofactor guanylyltransferase [Listeria monocytogenes]EDB1280115.1 molybdenum cofactor guanylyltransferase [Listeria monocytogenes]